MPSKVQQLLGRLDQLFGEARQANEQRYGDVIELLRGSAGRAAELGEQALGELSVPDALGSTARRRLRRSIADAGAQDTQDLVSRGLYNTTLLQTGQRLRARELEEGEQAIDAQVDAARRGMAQMRAGAITGQAGLEAGIMGNLAGFMERRTDAYPDVGSFLNLLGMLGGAAGTRAGRSGGQGWSFGGYGQKPDPIEQPKGQSGKAGGAELHTKSSLEKKFGNRIVPANRQDGSGYMGGQWVSPEEMKRLGYKFRFYSNDWIKE